MTTYERDRLENKFGTLALMYLAMRDALSEAKSSDFSNNRKERLNIAERAIKEYLELQPEVSKFTLDCIKEFEEEFKKLVKQVETDESDKQTRKEFCQKLENLILEFIGRAIDLRDRVYEDLPCSSSWHINRTTGTYMPPLRLLFSFAEYRPTCWSDEGVKGE